MNLINQKPIDVNFKLTKVNVTQWGGEVEDLLSQIPKASRRSERGLVRKDSTLSADLRKTILNHRDVYPEKCRNLDQVYSEISLLLS